MSGRALASLVLFLTCAAVSALFAPGLRAQTAERPNVVWILSDDQAWSDFGFTGSTEVRTPHLDALAAESAVFSRGYVPSSLCRPSLMSMITGLQPAQHGITGNDPPKGTDRREMLRFIRGATTVPDLLAARGYRSLQTGKWWEGNFREGGFTDGMTHGDPRRGGRHGDLGLTIGRKGMEPITRFLDDVGDAPFFLWYAPFLPHSPHDAPEDVVARYREDGRTEAQSRYLANVERFDDTIGELMTALRERNLVENTLVCLVVDNGWIQSARINRYAARSKRSPYEGGVRTPILVRWPGRVEPGVRDTVVTSLDLAPTTLAACGVAAPASMEGADLVAAALGAEPDRPGVFGEIYEHDVADLDRPDASLLYRWTVQGRHKLIVPTAADAAPELFDVVADPAEQQDLSAEQPDLTTSLRASIVGEAARRAGARRPKNVLVFLTDDQRFDQMSCAGHPVLRTPNIDSLAARGVRFTNSFVTTSICAASRATFLTGLHEGSHGFTFGTPPLSTTHPTWPGLLRASGFRTGFTGKLGVKLGSKPGELFDWFRPMSPPYLRPDQPHLTDRTAAAAVSFLESAPSDQPFALTVSFNAPHAEDPNPDQYIPPADLATLYEDAAVPPPILGEPEFFASLPPQLQDTMHRDRFAWRFDSEEKRVRMTRNYWRMISGVDRAVGRILEALEASGRADDTLIIFTSDNGYFLGDRGFAGKWTIHELSIRVPLIVVDPSLPTARHGATDDHMTLNIDLAPTILAAAGAPREDGLQGVDLGPLVRGEEVQGWRDEMFYEHRFRNARIPKSEGVRSDDWTYVRYYELDPLVEELYDLRADPQQARNLASDPVHAATLGELRARTDALRGRYVRSHD
jgi:arylsulfatase A-like enzyme